MGGKKKKSNIICFMRGKGKSMSASALPYNRMPPTWLKPASFSSTSGIAKEIIEKIIKLSKKFKPSEIGVILRDTEGIPQVKNITGSKILKILKIAGLAPKEPEDLFFLKKKCNDIEAHLEKTGHQHDKDSKYRLMLIKAHINRLEKYYRISREKKSFI